jgi:hypothetical protein
VQVIRDRDQGVGAGEVVSVNAKPVDQADAIFERLFYFWPLRFNDIEVGPRECGQVVANGQVAKEETGLDDEILVKVVVAAEAGV